MYKQLKEINSEADAVIFMKRYNYNHLRYTKADELFTISGIKDVDQRALVLQAVELLGGVVKEIGESSVSVTNGKELAQKLADRGTSFVGAQTFVPDNLKFKRPRASAPPDRDKNNSPSR